MANNDPWSMIGPEDSGEPCCMSAAHGQACACVSRDNMRLACEIAYGLLWRYSGDDPLVHRARRELLAQMDKEALSRGIRASQRLADDVAPDWQAKMLDAADRAFGLK